MRARILLPALWLLMLLLPVPRLRAQGRPLGPWRLTYQTVTEGPSNDWNGPIPGKKVSKLLPTPLNWDVAPDSIRLFINCENPLIAPPQPRNGQPAIHFSATGATVRVDAKSRRLLIAPTAATVTLWAHKGRALVFKHQFTAIPPPLPKIEGSYGGLMPNDIKPGEEWRSLTIKALPSPEFSSFMPNDARYRVLRSQVSLLRNSSLIRPPALMNGPQSVLGHPADFEHCDLIRVDVQVVQRMNFRGEIENIPFQKQLSIPVSPP